LSPPVERTLCSRNKTLAIATSPSVVVGFNARSWPQALAIVHEVPDSHQYAERRIFGIKEDEMESLRSLDTEAIGALEANPEMLFLLALVGSMQLLGPYLLTRLAGASAAMGLTRREIDVLTWVAAGKTNAETAELLSIAPGTVKKHLEHIYAKLGVTSRTDAAVTAIRLVIASRPRSLRTHNLLLIA
jgi:DNA-binding CsgD family transcriptional regulator